MTLPEPFHDDFVDVLREFAAEGVEHVVVGAHALAVHAVPRATGDLDILVRPDAANSARVWTALARFGAPLRAHGIAQHAFATEDLVYQIGLAPRRIDVLTSLTAVTFDEAMSSAVTVNIHGLDVKVLGREALLRNKRALGRHRDLADVEAIERGPGGP